MAPNISHVGLETRANDMPALTPTPPPWSPHGVQREGSRSGGRRPASARGAGDQEGKVCGAGEQEGKAHGDKWMEGVKRWTRPMRRRVSHMCDITRSCV